MTNLEATLNQFGIIGVKAIQNVLRPLSATGGTVKSVHFEVKIKNTIYSLIFYGRKFFNAIETGRGPRKSSEYQGYDKSMLEYMNARGIAMDKTPKEREHIARYMTLQINREGDKTYKSGGRVVFTPTIEKLEKEITEQITQDFIQASITRIKNGFNNNQTDRA